MRYIWYLLRAFLNGSYQFNLMSIFFKKIAFLYYRDRLHFQLLEICEYHTQSERNARKLLQNGLLLEVGKVLFGIRFYLKIN